MSGTTATAGGPITTTAGVVVSGLVGGALALALTIGGVSTLSQTPDPVDEPLITYDAG